MGDTIFLWQVLYINKNSNTNIKQILLCLLYDAGIVSWETIFVICKIFRLIDKAIRYTGAFKTDQSKQLVVLF